MPLQKTFKNHFARDLINDFDADTNNQYFIYFGKVDAWDDENSPDLLTDSVQAEFSAYRNALGIKRIERINAFHIITRYDWISGASYTQYDDTLDLSLLQYYVMTDEYNLYKCIDNGGGGKSTAKPTHTEPEIKASGADGYKWKFLGKVTENARRFLTDEYIPVEYVTNALEDENATQLLSQQMAVNGAIDKVTVTKESGVYRLATAIGDNQNAHKVVNFVRGSAGHTAGSNEYEGITLSLPETSIAFDIDQSNLLSATNVVGYDVYTSGGRGPDVGQKRRIVAFYDSDQGTGPYVNPDTDVYPHQSFVVLDRPFDRDLYSSDPPTKFRLLPPVEIYGDGSGAEARTEINDERNVTGVNMINRGKDYTTATVELDIENAIVIGTPSSAKAIIGPKGGHGNNPIKELQSSKIMVVMEIKQDESGKFRTSNQFRQFGIIKNPTLNDGTGRTAGTEYSKSKDIKISKPHGVVNDYSYVSNVANLALDTSTYKKDNYIMGQESFATARIVEFRTEAGATSSGVMELADIEGSFMDGSVDDKLVRYIFGASGSTLDGTAIAFGTDEDDGNTTDFQVGETVTQHNATILFDKNTPGITGSTAEGVVNYWNSENKELIIRVTKNAFTKSATAGFVRGGTAAYITFNRFEDKGGELIKQFSISGTAGGAFGGTMEFVTFDVDSKQNYGRIMSMTATENDNNSNPTYRTATRMIVEKDSQTSGDASFTSTSFTADAIVSQGNTGSLVQGTVLEWFTFGGFTGELYLTNVKGGFTGHLSGFDTSTYGNKYKLNNFTDEFISGVSGSEIIQGSGEVLYIQNIRPVSRSIEQNEELKMVIGF
tara:strand:+ start:583 stop:3072 length:2490 start_codon:yes stop_codon:yes gene_type:complete